MGTIKSSETLAMAEHLRSQRTLTAAEVDSRAEDHSPLVRYENHDRHIPAAH